MLLAEKAFRRAHAENPTAWAKADESPAAIESSGPPLPTLRFCDAVRLIGVTLKPWRAGLPVRQPGVVIANRHLDLRQTLFVEYFVLRDHLVQEEQVGRHRIYFIGGQTPLIPERHAPMDV